MSNGCFADLKIVTFYKIFWANLAWKNSADDIIGDLFLISLRKQAW